MEKRTAKEDRAIIRSYNRSELAGMYLPGVAQSTARRKFSLWLNINKPLLTELAKLGANEHTRTFTPKQVKAIFDQLGCPDGEYD